MTEPYYQDESVTIYHADCMDVLGSLPPADLIFTSPPYNLGVSAGGGFGHYADDAGLRLRGGGGKWTGGTLAHGYDGHCDAMPMAAYEEWQQDVLCACWAQLGDAGAIFYNHKPRVQAKTLWMPTRLNPDLPLRQMGRRKVHPTGTGPDDRILVFAKPGWRLKNKGASGIGDVWRVAQEASEHPASFPLALPAYAIESAGPSLVLDPFMGSGTTLRAAKDAGVRAIGIDLSERYCEMAACWLAQEVFDIGAATSPSSGVEPEAG